MIINESGMSFGDFAPGLCFHIENSSVYKRIQNSIKTAEFVLLRLREQKPPEILIVEAKSSAPHPHSEDNFNEYVAAIKDKFVNTLSLTLACCLHRHYEFAHELPAGFQDLDLSKVNVKFVLVVRGWANNWLQPLHDVFNKEMSGTAKIWHLTSPSAVVLNDELARRHGLIAN